MPPRDPHTSGSASGSQNTYCPWPSHELWQVTLEYAPVSSVVPQHSWPLPHSAPLSQGMPTTSSPSVHPFPSESVAHLSYVVPPCPEPPPLSPWTAQHSSVPTLQYRALPLDATV